MQTQARTSALNPQQHQLTIPSSSNAVASTDSSLLAANGAVELRRQTWPVLPASFYSPGAAALQQQPSLPAVQRPLEAASVDFSSNANASTTTTTTATEIARGRPANLFFESIQINTSNINSRPAISGGNSSVVAAPFSAESSAASQQEQALLSLPKKSTPLPVPAPSPSLILLGTTHNQSNAPTTAQTTMPTTTLSRPESPISIISVSPRANPSASVQLSPPPQPPPPRYFSLFRP